MKSNLSLQKGFTLVELMVVVAIIGLLSAVAIPNFQKYQARSKTTEAKLQLASIYTAQETFFSNFQIYHNCLSYMGVDPRNEISSRYFIFGFYNTANIQSDAYATAVNSGLTQAECPNGLDATEGTTYFNAGKRIGANLADFNHLTVTTVGDGGTSATDFYKASAAGIIHKDYIGTSGANASAAFSINQKKIIVVERNGF